MEKKILLQNLADAIAEKEGLTKKKAENFTKAFFDIIEEGLAEDKFVKIKGFGTFKIILVGERESVDVNTGERIQISGHSKITFTPDAWLKDLVNKPFAHFQTVTLNEETDLNELESIVTEEEDSVEAPKLQAEFTPAPQIQQPTATDEVEKVVPEVPADEATADEPQTADEPAATKEENTANQPEEPGYTSQEAVSPPGAAEPESPQHSEEEEETTVQAALLSEEELPDIAEAETESPAGDQEDEHTAETENPLQPDAETIAQTNAEEEENTDAEAPYSQPASPSETATRRRYKRWRIAMFVIFTLLLMCMSYFAGYFRVLCPNCLPPVANQLPDYPSKVPAPHPTTKDIPQAADTLGTRLPADSIGNATRTSAADSLPAISGKTEKEQQPQSDSLPKANSTPKQEETYVVQRGDNIYSIARKVYGSKKYAQRIIRYNHLKNPDSIEAGSILKLPRVEPTE